MTKENVISNLTQIPIESVALGVRFEPRFELVDRFGSIIDKILRTEGSPFKPELFPLTDRAGQQNVLYNPENGDKITLTQRDAVLAMQVDTRKPSDIEVLSDNFDAYILRFLREGVHLRDINRYGVLLKLGECRDALSEMPIEHYVHQDFHNIHDMSLRFTRRLPLEEALGRKRVDDYRNVIYTVNQTEEGDVRISVDYQEYFKPALNKKEFEQKPFKDFVTRGIGYYLGEFQKWLDKIVRKSEAA